VRASTTEHLESCRLKWKRRVAGMGIAELTRLRQLEDENKKLKALVADLTADKHMLQEVL
jgi:putative transposase